MVNSSYGEGMAARVRVVEDGALEGFPATEKGGPRTISNGREVMTIQRI